MATILHTIKATPGSHKRKKRVGRGNASQKGTTAGRGMKGQKARSGGKGGLALKGFKRSLQKVPKIRGFNSLKPKKQTITLSVLERVAKDGDVVTPKYLKKMGVIDKPQFGVKVIATGELKKKITLKGCFASKMAVVAIEKAGGKLEF
ncbi:MAG: 50S ribosomal protein L15 [Candidatus Magasanikbacteria bacterium RIFCSPHIGHO2_01_FULL_33_34]|uniref:Large ribosomal subunit protein uL15 n=1 Tax=Candidatus Magasanikbacteria bacterium RIFCSPHIGHO2_01_FULL_33_34 TaxID=1798671 RepID=A0A1F6LLJ6_9BACT|nr:MAG: 50S ribosomal protein L15 [Candidatus Magasanikbacteria bacterium RIFCSPHIGHO2_01_FULL_33_34]OGH65984.1 MAG: 50S ribosomal protein L15 [Candidatus Magasanikbacteria bacterium RIFCSPHIGHO2_02_FULL_33_17]OGH76379.1 MAG: 50S ribosomal protein L15 [Candidatus Magasanikbacteria bacterium RIFCSPLOWO2_01_FULL_33_34]OGH81485.1 MAG: 50S ribosomal protein L15 [Candidatus Magasanikbacteria bacterium RIFCSPLOWO2_12_FULL_34_7]